jgi:hypothetical protein
MRMLVSVEFADVGTRTGKHPVLVVGGCSGTTAPGDIGISLEEAKTLLSALQWQYVAAQAAEITEKARRCDLCGSRQPIKDWSRRPKFDAFGGRGRMSLTLEFQYSTYFSYAVADVRKGTW